MWKRVRLKLDLCVFIFLVTSRQVPGLILMLKSDVNSEEGDWRDWYELKKTGQESSMIHSASPQSRPAVKICLFCSILKNKDERTDMCEYSDQHQPGLWSASWIKKPSLDTPISWICNR